MKRATEGAGTRATTNDSVLFGRRTLKSEPMTDRITIAKTDTTMLQRGVSRVAWSKS